jgi:hypothetical protein
MRVSFLLCAGFISFAVAQPECPRYVYCSSNPGYSNVLMQCDIYCGGSGGSVTFKTCIASKPMYPSECSCISSTPPCVIPAYEVCMNPASTSSECTTQVRGTKNYGFILINGVANCSAPGCLALSSDNKDPRVSTPQPSMQPTSLPTMQLTPTIQVTPTMQPTVQVTPTMQLTPTTSVRV